MNGLVLHMFLSKTLFHYGSYHEVTQKKKSLNGYLNVKQLEN
jgi:hypothetical protein